jgi:tetratricopeptide (TPR) repeat protein
VVYSHLQRPADAVTEYDRALRLLPGEPELVHLSRRRQEAMILGNSAEALMAMGKLDEAIRRYALAESIDRSEQATLHALGLAIAYDRDGQVQKSRDAVARALAADPGLRLFQSDDVFFIPDGDRHYYWGLINEAQERRDDALRSFRTFLDELPTSRYAARARSHIEELKRQPGLSVAELMRAQVLLAPPQFPAEAMSAGGTPRKHRSEAEIQRVTRERVFDLRQCYARALQKTPKLHGDLLLGMMLDRSGAVVLVQPLENTLGVGSGELPVRGDSTVAGGEARFLLSCVQGVVQRWRFSPADPDNVDADELALPMRFTTGL